MLICMEYIDASVYTLYPNNGNCKISEQNILGLSNLRIMEKSSKYLLQFQVGTPWSRC